MVDAPTKMKHSLANSEGWMEKLPMKIQFLAPLRLVPRTMVASSNPTPSTAAT